jgi:hypothetical protein
MIISGTIKQHHLFNCLFYLANIKIKSKKLLVVLISTLGGILPVEGRVTLSAGILNTLSPETTTTCSKARGKFGIIDYLSTHHYYLWSPLEKTIILPMAALGVSYSTMIGYTWPILIITLLFIGWYSFFKLKEEDIVIEKLKNKYSTKDYLKIVPFISGIILMILGFPGEYIFGSLALFYLYITKTFNLKIINRYINWKLVLTLMLILIAGHITTSYNSEILNFIKNFAIDINSTVGIFLLTFIVFISSWLMGSSGKFAGIVSLLIILYGPQWFIWFFIIDFIAYNLSPTHKCAAIGNSYFGTKISEYLKIIGAWQIFLFVYAFIFTFILH